MVGMEAGWEGPYKKGLGPPLQVCGPESLCAAQRCGKSGVLTAQMETKIRKPSDGGGGTWAGELFRRSRVMVQRPLL